MVGKLFIDGLDAFSEYGIFVEQYGYKALVQMPSFKKLNSTEWPEYDGEEVDLTDPILDSKTFSIPFCITDILSASDLFEVLSDGAYHIFDFAELGKSYKLRLLTNPALSAKIQLGKITLNFADDFPPVYPTDETDIESLNEYNTLLNQAPYATAPAGFKQNGYEMDDVDFSRFGVYVLDGTDRNIQKAPNVRENLKVDVTNRPGVSYDGESVFYKAKDVAMKLFIYADSIAQFWERWYALFTALLKPELRKLYNDNTLEEYNCYYKSNAVTRFDIRRNGRVWCEFTVTLTFPDSRPDGNYCVLATEDKEVVITEPEKEEAHAILSGYDKEENIGTPRMHLIQRAVDYRRRYIQQERQGVARIYPVDRRGDEVGNEKCDRCHQRGKLRSADGRQCRAEGAGCDDRCQYRDHERQQCHRRRD